MTSGQLEFGSLIVAAMQSLAHSDPANPWSEGEGMCMPMRWRKIASFVSLVGAIVLAVWMRSVGYDWKAAIGAAGIVWVCFLLAGAMKDI